MSWFGKESKYLGFVAKKTVAIEDARRRGALRMRNVFIFEPLEKELFN